MFGWGFGFWVVGSRSWGGAFGVQDTGRWEVKS
jgi:hypothetical protein